MQLSSLSAHRLNNTRKAEIDILFFNRAAKVGSEALIQLLYKLEDYNNINVDHNGPKMPAKKQMKRWEQNQIAEEIIDLGAESAYMAHINYIDFKEFDLPKPIYINLVRDPVERVISWYFYARGSYKNAIEYRKNPEKKMKSADWYKKNFNECVRSGDEECQYIPFTIKETHPNFKRQSLFFCGHHDDCQ